MRNNIKTISNSTNPPITAKNKIRCIRGGMVVDRIRFKLIENKQSGGRKNGPEEFRKGMLEKQYLPEP